MSDEQDPIRLVLLERLRRGVLPWLVETALGFPEIREGLSLANLDEKALAEDVRTADHLLAADGPELAAVHRIVSGADGRIDETRLRRELAKGDWPIRWAICNATPPRASAPPPRCTRHWRTGARCCCATQWCPNCAGQSTHTCRAASTWSSTSAPFPA